jgi:dolichol-phosphate mannosyltransferase
MVKYISIILPTYNEEKNIKRIFFSIKKNFKYKYYDIIFVDDNSSDKTRKEIIDLSNKFKNIKYIFRNKRNLATAFLDATKKSSSELIILMDSDLQHDTKNLHLATNIMFKKNYDFILGSRFLKDSKIKLYQPQSLFRLFLSKIFNLIFNIIFQTKISDPLTGFFLSKRKILIKNHDKFFKSGFKIILDYIIIYKNQYKFKEFPIILNQRSYGKSKINFRILYLIIKQIIFHLKKNTYKKFFNSNIF